MCNKLYIFNLLNGHRSVICTAANEMVIKSKSRLKLGLNIGTVVRSADFGVQNFEFLMKINKYMFLNRYTVLNKLFF